MLKTTTANNPAMRRFMYDKVYPVIDGLHEMNQNGGSAILSSVVTSAAGAVAIAKYAPTFAEQYFPTVHNAMQAIPTDAYYATAIPMGMMASALVMTALATPFVMSTTKDKIDRRFKLNGVLLPGALTGVFLSLGGLPYAAARTAYANTFEKAAVTEAFTQLRKPAITHAGKQYTIVHPALKAAI